MALTAGFEAVLDDEGKSLDASLSNSETLPSYVLTDNASKNKMAADDERDLQARPLLAELAPGRLNRITQFKSNTNS